MKVYVCYSYYYDTFKIDRIVKTKEQAENWVGQNHSIFLMSDWVFNYTEMEVEDI